MKKLLLLVFLTSLAWKAQGNLLHAAINNLEHLLSDSQETDDENPDILAGFYCKQDGLYAHPRNCSQFIHCSNKVPHIKDCPGNLHFSEKSDKCEEKCDAHCDKTVACECHWPACDTKAICFYPPKKGPCKGAFNRYHFEKRSGKCVPFTYGGCRGNENNFPTREACEGKCVEESNEQQSNEDSISMENKNAAGDEDAICSLPPVAGNCFARMTRYFYNRYTKRCTIFIYGGCGGNKNNFETREECEQTCKANEQESSEMLDQRPPAKEYCQLEKEVGPCKQSLTRYYYNKNKGYCQSFIYGGCQGNRNNFEKKKDCIRDCVRDPSPEHSSEDDLEDTELHSENEVCQLDKDEGPCKKNMPRYYYNKEMKTCEKFVYGGCKGNGNNFRSKTACTRTCVDRNLHAQSDSEEQDNMFDAEDEDGVIISKGGRSKDFCKLDKDSGPCMKHEKRYYYNSIRKHCLLFIYGGCQGNKNNFKTKKACKNACVRKTKTDISSDKQNTRHDFDEFANANSQEEAETSNDHEYPCLAPKDPGPCKQSIKRYYFDRNTGECKQFIYGGCGGNVNNFESVQQCERTCLVRQ